MDVLSIAASITALITAASSLWTALEDIRSVDRNLQDRQTEIDLLSIEFKAIHQLLGMATGTSTLTGLPPSGALDVNEGLVRFREALIRLEGVMHNIRSSQGKLGRVIRGLKMKLKKEEQARLKELIALSRLHLQTMLQVRGKYVSPFWMKLIVPSYLLELLAAEYLPQECLSAESSRFSQVSVPVTITVDSPAHASLPSSSKLRPYTTVDRSTSTSDYELPRILMSADKEPNSFNIHCSLVIPATPEPPPTRPPTLNYRGFQLVDLTTLLPPKFGKIHLNAISPGGEVFGLSSKKKFALLDKRSLVCAGKLQGIARSPRVTASRSQKSPIIKTMALNDEYLFLGTENSILVFQIRGNLGGQMSFARDMDDNLMLDKLVISPDGTILLALARNPLDGSQISLIYPSSKVEATPFNESFVPTNRVIWSSCKQRVHRLAAFSTDGRKVAIVTSHCRNGQSEVRFMEKTSREWLQSRETLIITVLPNEEEGQLGVKGITGVAMYNPSQHITHQKFAQPIRSVVPGFHAS